MMERDLYSHLSALAAEAIAPVLKAYDAADLLDSITLERPAVPDHGDLSLNTAMAAASRAGKPPRELAQELADALEQHKHLGGSCREIGIAGPGFINMFLTDRVLSKAVADALSLGDGFGCEPEFDSGKVLLEFVSANPTGPLHAGHARYAAYGDSLRRIMQCAGYDVTTEFYINDYGTQMELFGRSLAARYAQELGRKKPLPEDGYQGEYLKVIAGMIVEKEGDAWLERVLPEPDRETIEHFSRVGSAMILDRIGGNLERFRVEFDDWFSEASLYVDDHLGRLIRKLQGKGDVFERDGATWMRTSLHGDDKDRVLIRSNSEPTYFASDIIYHQDKLSRGYDRLINIWGADHHGYVQRVQAAFEALSGDPDKLEIIIGQLVNVLERGEKQQMSKRAGKMVTLEELLDSIGVDAARFFLVDRSHDSTLDLDLEKAKLKSDENPVYYVQYAHARICSILRKAEAEDIKTEDWFEPKLQEQERSLILKLMELPGTVKAAAETRGPHRLTAYARDLAATFHVFYHNCPVIRSAAGTAAFRMDLCRLSRNAIRITLGLIGVNAPESM